MITQSQDSQTYDNYSYRAPVQSFSLMALKKSPKGYCQTTDYTSNAGFIQRDIT